ncbi:DUF1194 domain-containing protein [Mesorhizobium sp. M0767]
MRRLSRKQFGKGRPTPRSARCKNIDLIAIDVSVDAFDKLPVPTLRRVIDISGDGTNNDGSSDLHLKKAA